MIEKIKIAVIGNGALSSIFIDQYYNYLTDNYELLGIMGRNEEKVKKFAHEKNTKYYLTLDNLLKDKPDIIIEIASRDVIIEYAEEIIKNKIDLVVVSVGALDDVNFYNKLYNLAKRNRTKIYIAPGAIGGFDLLKTMNLMDKSEVKISTYKPYTGLEGAKYLQGKTLDKNNKELVFLGNAKEAIDGFPKNVNVSVAASIAGIGVDDTEVSIYSMPKGNKNMHKIEVENSYGNVEIKIEMTPDKNNPKSSVITAWSVVSLLLNLASPIELF
ncbi:MAG TPA: aspartate dehydrogenase domain-containing protein [Tissierellaceae bacterium]